MLCFFPCDLCKIIFLSLETLSVVYSEPCGISKMEPFAKIVNSFQSLTVFTKTICYMLDRVLTTLLHVLLRLSYNKVSKVGKHESGI